MILKSGVRLHGLRPQTVVALIITNDIYVANGIATGCLVTSINDSTHGRKSKHPRGEAFDVRLPSRMLKGDDWEQVIHNSDRLIHKQIVEALPDFDVLLEEHQSSPINWHIHVEWDPS